jgi:hypothetical protein
MRAAFDFAAALLVVVVANLTAESELGNLLAPLSPLRNRLIALRGGGEPAPAS